jgi:hypothetical protein
LSNFTKDYEPKSIQKWLDKFPNLNIRTICRVLNLSFLQSDIREVAYKLFHNVIFTKEMLLRVFSFSFTIFNHSSGKDSNILLTPFIIFFFQSRGNEILFCKIPMMNLTCLPEFNQIMLWYTLQENIEKKI